MLKEWNEMKSNQIKWNRDRANIDIFFSLIRTHPHNTNPFTHLFTIIHDYSGFLVHILPPLYPVLCIVNKVNVLNCNWFSVISSCCKLLIAQRQVEIILCWRSRWKVCIAPPFDPTAMHLKWLYRYLLEKKIAYDSLTFHPLTAQSTYFFKFMQ